MSILYLGARLFFLRIGEDKEPTWLLERSTLLPPPNHVIIRAMQTIGLIADTHIPDRARKLPPKALEIFRQAKVTAILHAGDISTQPALDQLAEIAPVHAVRGNRDWFLAKDLPLHREMQFEEITIGISHGHGSWSAYLIDKLRYLLRGPGSFRKVEERMLALFPQADVVVFGHNHVPVNRIEENGQLLFNPGSPCCPNVYLRNVRPSVGLLTIDKNKVHGEIMHLDQ